MNRTIRLSLALMALFFAPLLQAEVSSCDAWFGNKVRTGLTRLTSPEELEQLKSEGVTIEPNRRMRAEGYPWEHEIQIALPRSYGSTDRSFPVLWVTDGSMLFRGVAQFMASCAGKHVPHMIVVAIGLPPEAEAEYQRRRTFDFSPNEVVTQSGFGSALANERRKAFEEKQKKEGKYVAENRLGGAPRFLSFLVKDVRQQLAKQYRMADDHTFFGDSAGGLFCAYALFAQPSAFNRYVCGSPALGANDFEVFRMEERYAQKNEDLPVKLFLAAGEAEVLNTVGIVSSMTHLAEILKMRAYPSLKLDVHIFPGETHGSVIPLNIAWGLRSVLE